MAQRMLPRDRVSPRHSDLPAPKVRCAVSRRFACIIREPSARLRPELPLYHRRRAVIKMGPPAASMIRLEAEASR
jgi:hypothetical protein